MPDKFDINLSLLPPKLQLHLWILGLDANTSKVNIAYQRNSFRTGLAYNYGGNIEAFLSINRFSSTVGVDPSHGNVDLGMIYRGYNFNVSGNVQRQGFSLGVSYGAGLFPFPAKLTNTFNQGGMGASHVMSSIAGGERNPLTLYELHSNDMTAISQAVSTARQISRVGNSPQRFGAGLRLNYTSQTGLVIYAGANLIF
jgi:hypothetical protein